jgi:hypothetical protein
VKVSDGRFEMVLEKKFSLHLSLAALDLELAFNVDSVPNSVKISYALNDDEIGSTPSDKCRLNFFSNTISKRPSLTFTG